MKTIIDTLKEIIKQDASTQTDPVTIIEKEEDMATPNISIGESGEDTIKKRQKFSDDTDVYTVMSGSGTAQERAKCKAYLNSVDPEGYNYYSLLQTIEADIKNNIDLNASIISIFVAHDESFEEKEKRATVLKQATAAVYMICADKGINNKDIIYADLNDTVETLFYLGQI